MTLDAFTKKKNYRRLSMPGARAHQKQIPHCTNYTQKHRLTHTVERERDVEESASHRLYRRPRSSQPMFFFFVLFPALRRDGGLNAGWSEPSPLPASDQYPHLGLRSFFRNKISGSSQRSDPTSPTPYVNLSQPQSPPLMPLMNFCSSVLSAPTWLKTLYWMDFDQGWASGKGSP